jgi:2-haloacid dehalogenase
VPPRELVGNAIGLPSIRVNRRHGKRGAGATIQSDAVAPMTVDSLAELVAHHRAAVTATA